MRVLVTGVGFIGTYVVEELLNRGHEVIAFDRYRRGNLPEGTDFFLGDVIDPIATDEALAHAEGFIHLAAILGTQEQVFDPIAAATTNVLGSLNIFQAAARHNVPGVYIAVGNHTENNTYSITKTTAERFTDMYNKYRDTTISVVRPVNAYGPRQLSVAPYGPGKVKKIMPAFVNAAIRGLPIEVYGDGEQIADMIFVADAAKVLVTALEKGITGRPFEAGMGQPVTVNQIATLVNEIAGSSGGIKHLPMRPGETPNAVVMADPSTLAPLGITTDDLTSLDVGVENTIKWFRSQLDRRS